ncbi:hypothetical protein DYB36_000765 [Aphanomyces astaci]|uniref:Peptidase S9 prolyl oligopeptidase catalytic domain-containing protein n=1 Tax=Aphanomyces astaci TaxID=112090 RepID=A0A397AUN6_APHAT|nr:hypothetical protein DYB36_000765 [Aphanomyces astaci]
MAAQLAPRPKPTRTPTLSPSTTTSWLTSALRLNKSYCTAKAVGQNHVITIPRSTDSKNHLVCSRCLACLDVYPNVDRIQHVRCRTLIIHGVEDMEIPISHGHGLLQALPVECQAVPYWVPDRGHNDIGETAACRPAYVDHIAAYLETL